jgi:hypothetical protein
VEDASASPQTEAKARASRRMTNIAGQIASHHLVAPDLTRTILP